MRLFIYLILLSCIFINHSSSNYILCTSHCSQIIVSFLEPLTLPFECQETHSITYIYDHALVCFVSYRIDYDLKQIYINFKATNDTTNLEKYNQSQTLDQSIWLGLNQEAHQPNITDRKYECNTKNDCARQFYLTTIQSLITTGKSLLDKIHLKLYNQSVPIHRLARRPCIDSNKIGNKTSVRCGHGLCYAHQINSQLNEKSDLKSQNCNSDLTATLFSEIKSYLSESIQYRCNKKLCNNDKMIGIIKEILNEYTNWNNQNIKEAEDKEEINTTEIIIQKSSTIQRIVSFHLIIFSLISIQILF